MNVALEGLNPQQQEAVQHFEGPLLILAGAGSGKTRVLTNRIAWLIREKGIAPWNILAITFTNKAAGEMRERVDRMVGNGADSIWVATFHSTCGRILRRHIGLIGYDPSFSIYDSEDQKNVIRTICREQGIDTKLYKEKMFLSAISSAKDELISPQAFCAAAGSDRMMKMIGAVYQAYQKTLKQSSALDFDDMIALTVQLFEQCPDVLEMYRARFRFILVDEYQDTNTAQFRLISLLAGPGGNLCVVGDDDQSIYRFRGANIQNILNFEKIYPGTKVVRLEQNYRSTQNILDVANAVIANNSGRKRKTLWTDNESGRKVRFKQLDTAFEEAEFIAGDIARQVAAGASYGDFAVLYRTNAQSRLLEEKMLLLGVPYRIVGGINFYARKEIKDLLAYLKAIANPNDDLSFTRVINIPRRGIGETTIGRVASYASVNGLSFYEALLKSRQIPGIGRTGAKTEGFGTFIRTLKSKAAVLSVRQLMQEVIDQTGYVKELEAEGSEEARDRIDNIGELINKIAAYEASSEAPSLDGFLQEVSLVADIDTLEDKNGQVVLMTLHSAKGLEYPQVYLSGMEEGIFPSYMSISADDPKEEIEEERRLCYVGITRAMKSLTLTCARMRMLRGETRYNKISRFVEEIPREMLDEEEQGGGFSRSSFQGFSSRHAGFGESNPSHPAGKSLGRERPYLMTGAQMKKADHLEYGVGDRVKHVKFGTGTVTDIKDGGRDYEVTVQFDQAGVKKMLAAFARLQKV